jgi:hypothetical protein
MLEERALARLRELVDDDDKVLAIINCMYDNGDLTEEEIFDIGDDEEFNIENVENYDLGEDYQIYDDAVGTNINYNYEDWYVFDDYDSAVSAAIEDTKLLLDDIGIDGINFDNLGGIENFVDADWFEDALKESFESYCYDIEYEGDNTYDNRLVQECYDNDLIDDDDFELDEDGEIDYTQCTLDTDELVERYVDDYMSRLYDPISEFISQFGEDEFNRVIKDNGLVDMDELAEAIVDVDGPANSLSRYDGNEVEYDFDGTTYYMYRNN